MANKKAKAPKRKRVTFVIESEPGKTVSVAGSFNEWNPCRKVLSDKNEEGVYQGTMLLEPGTYEYKFFIDDAWCIDPRNPNFSPNEMGTLNSVLVVE
ncbi:glycogen-binding domain-containing protein [Lentisphaerota bacterium ZTH]|nr:glycogen-binding domain-containing protein [Lentisphaerota bacterium]WET07397.1 glycogen-binding domain-containing protein [Lentisphaerota bacterium ZTH]